MTLYRLILQMFLKVTCEIQFIQMIRFTVFKETRSYVTHGVYIFDYIRSFKNYDPPKTVVNYFLDMLYITMSIVTKAIR